ncbi:hypothetical protein, partial [Streptomyces hygroscopicus]|uniref:hypothetical protein n=1 Tax=Streptomyces hygroscopicus TaxID=1912 RepID=UPI003557EB90
APWRTRWTRSICTTSPATAAAARAELTEVLSRPAHASAHRVSAAGHAHIDSAWLWPAARDGAQGVPHLRQRHRARG